PGGTLLETEGGARLKERAQCLDRLAGPLGDRTDPAFERRGSRVHADLPTPSLHQAAEPAEQGAPRLWGVRHLVPGTAQRAEPAATHRVLVHLPGDEAGIDALFLGTAHRFLDLVRVLL